MGARNPFGTDLSAYFQHNLELAYRFEIDKSIEQIVTTNQKATYAEAEPEQVERVPFLQRFPFLYRDINKVSRGIFFDYDKSELKPEVTQFILPEVITELIKRPSLRILIEGHADEDGSEKYNLALSMRRAQAIADFLINAGVSPNRIDTQALGNNVPAIRASDEDAKARNRRAVILEQK
jgi:outer membrane protein OmpA-like peptidoglycan-associated protein